MLRRGLATTLFVAMLCGVAGCRGAGLPGADYPETAKVERVEAKAALPVEVLSLRYDYRLDADGGFVRTIHQRYRVLTEQGVTEWGQTGASWSPWYQERPELSVTVTSPAGEISKLDPTTISEAAAYPDAPDLYSDARVLRAPLPSMKVGAVVDETIVTRTKHAFLGNGYAHEARFQSLVAANEVELTIDMPESLPLRYEVRDAKVTIDDTRAAGRRRLHFRGGPYPGLVPTEPMLPSDVPAWPHVAFSTGASWQPFAETYAHVVDEALRDADLAGAVAKVVKPSDAPEVKAARLLDWIRKRVRYAGIEFGDSAVTPQKPAETLKRGYGDCKDQAVLLVGLLREAGVPARVALLRAGLDEDVRKDLPALNVFNHAIVVVPGAAPLWIDPTADQARAGELPEPDRGRLALVIDGGTRELSRTPSPEAKHNQYREVRTVHLPELGKARIVEVSSASGFMERSLRRNFLDAGDKLKDGLSKYIGQTYNTTRLGAVDVSPADDLSVPFHMSVEAHDARVAISDLVSAEVIINPDAVFGWVPHSLAEGDGRSADLALPTPYEAELRYELHPPAGLLPGDLPALADVALGPAKMERAIEARRDGVVEARFRFSLPKGRWSAAEVTEFRKAYAALRQEPHARVSFLHAGQKHLRERRPDLALDTYRREAGARPKDAIPKARLAAALADLGFGASARRLAGEAVRLDPENAHLHLIRGRILLRDPFGRSYHRGYDRAGALAAFREAVKRDPTEMEAQVEIGVLLEHDDDAQRYSDGSQLAEAVAHFDKIDQAALAAYLDGQYLNNPLYDLMWAGRFDELRGRLAKLPRERVPAVVAIVAAAAMAGPNAGVAEVLRLNLPAESRAEILDGAASTLVNLRKYPEAAAITEAAAATSSDAGLRMRVLSHKKLKRIDPAKMPDAKPEELVIKAFSLLAASPKLTDAQARALVSARAFDKKGGSVVVDELKQVGDASLELGFRSAVFADAVAVSQEATTDGNAAVGFRVRMRPATGTGQPVQAFVTRDAGALRLRAFGDQPSELGCEALHRAKSGDKKAAAQWLDWARELVGSAAGEDPLRVEPFARLWASGKGDVELAAAALCGDGRQADQAIGPLEAARAKASGEQQVIVDHALALAYLHTGQLKEALAASARLEKAVPTTTIARALGFAALADLGHHDAIAARARQLLATKPEDELLLTILAQAEDAQGHAAEAYRAADKLIAAGRASAGDFNNQAWRSLFVGTVTEKDLGYALRAAQAKPKEPAYLNTLAALYAELGRTADAEETLKKILPLEPGGDPGSADWYVVGRLAERLALPDEAKAAYARVSRPPKRQEGTAWTLAQKRLKALP